MAHTALGLVSAEVYNTTQDKTLALTSSLLSNTLLVAVFGGYGASPATVTSISDSNGNAWDWIFRSSASGNSYAGIAWSRISGAMDTSDTVTINMGGGHTRSYAHLRAYEGLGASEFDVCDGGSEGTSSWPATCSTSLSYSAAGRGISIVIYPTEQFSSDLWVGTEWIQTENYNDATNVDTFSIGEDTVTGSGTTTPSNSLGVNSQWTIVGVTLPEQAMITPKTDTDSLAVTLGESESVAKFAAKVDSDSLAVTLGESEVVVKRGISSDVVVIL
jgi:hypothetical protein